MTFLSELPADQWVQCFSFLSSCELIETQVVSRRWYELSHRPLARVVACIGHYQESESAWLLPHVCGSVEWQRLHRCIHRLTIYRQMTARLSLQDLSTLRILHIQDDVYDGWVLPLGLEELECQRLSPVESRKKRILPSLRRLTATQVPHDLDLVTPILQSLSIVGLPEWDQAVIDSWPSTLTDFKTNEQTRFSSWPPNLHRLELPSLHDIMLRTRPALPSSLRHLTIDEWTPGDVLGPAAIDLTPVHLETLEVKGRDDGADTGPLLLEDIFDWHRQRNFQTDCLIVGSLLMDWCESERETDLQRSDLEADQIRSEIAHNGVKWILLPIRQGRQICSILGPPLFSCRTIWRLVNWDATAPELVPVRHLWQSHVLFLQASDGT